MDRDITRTGEPPRLRVAGPADVAGIVALYRGLGPESRLLRFSAPLPDALLVDVAAIDPVSDHVVVAVQSGRVVGEARAHRDPDGVHEIALTVAEEAQGQGLGSALLDRLRSDARERGVVTLRAAVRVDNRRMLTLLRRAGAALVHAGHGEIVLDIASDGAMPGWPSEVRDRRVLVEAPGSMERPVTTALREAGYDVRQCSGPGRGRLDPCPLLSSGRCRLVDEADLIVCLLPGASEDDRAVAAAHAADRPERLERLERLGGRPQDPDLSHPAG